MIKLDDNLLTELGLGGLPKEEKADFLKHMYETLEMRVGTRLAERMSDAQMSEFEQFISSNDEQGAFHWLEANFPDYKDVVADEFDKLKVEIKPVADQIVAASVAAGQSQIPDQSAPQAQQPQSEQGQMSSQQPAYQQTSPQQHEGYDVSPHQPQYAPQQPYQPQPNPYQTQPQQPGQPQYPQYGQPPQMPPQPPYGQQQ